MSKKKIIIMLVLLMIIIATISYFIFDKIQKNKSQNEISEYIPQKEIDEKRVKTNCSVFIL